MLVFLSAATSSPCSTIAYFDALMHAPNQSSTLVPECLVCRAFLPSHPFTSASLLTGMLHLRTVRCRVEAASGWVHWWWGLTLKRSHAWRYLCWGGSYHWRSPCNGVDHRMRSCCRAVLCGKVRIVPITCGRTLVTSL